MNQDQISYRYTNSYTEVFSCLFMHDYYLNRVCNEIDVMPTSATSELIKNYQLIFKPISGGFALAANTARDYSNAVFRDSFNLNFEFRFLNPYFYSFTALNIDPDVKYFLDDNFMSSVLFGSEVQTAAPELDRPGLSGILNVKHNPNYPILPIDGSDKDTFIVRSKVVYIKPREVRLVYICYTNDPHLDNFEGLTIEIEGVFKDIIAFSAPEQILTASGLHAVKFTSESFLPMKASWRGFFKLERRNQLGFYQKSLPNPSPKTIKFDNTTKTYISENYVKL